jgi:lipopolysaccharide heptosyltransferase II
VPAPSNFHPKKVLIINIFGIGDVLFTTPLIRNLKLQFPDIAVGYICNRRTAVMLGSYSDISRLFVYERDEFVAVGQKSRWQYVVKVSNLINEIRAQHYDTVIDVSLSRFMGFISWAAGIKTRTGFNYKNRGFLLNDPLLLKGYEERHVVEYYLELLTHLGVNIRSRELEIAISGQDTDWADHFFSENKIRHDRPVIAVVPGGGSSWGADAKYKQWGAASYAKLADKMVEKFGAQIILMGDTKDMDLACLVAEQMTKKPLSVCGQTSLTQFAAMAKQCTLVVLNDGGPLHVAVAAKAKTVSIFGPVDERVYGPYPSGQHEVVTKDLPCRPCYRRFRRAECEHVSCLQAITVEEVLEKVEKLLDGWSPVASVTDH